MQLLIAAGADVKERNLYGDIPLHLAAFNGNSRMALWLIEKGADLSTKNAENKTALDIAQMEGHTEFVQQIWNHYIVMQGKDNQTSTALCIALPNEETAPTACLAEVAHNRIIQANDLSTTLASTDRHATRSSQSIQCKPTSPRKGWCEKCQAMTAFRKKGFQKGMQRWQCKRYKQHQQESYKSRPLMERLCEPCPSTAC